MKSPVVFNSSQALLCRFGPMFWLARLFLPMVRITAGESEFAVGRERLLLADVTGIESDVFHTPPVVTIVLNTRRVRIYPGGMLLRDRATRCEKFLKRLVNRAEHAPTTG